jgi:hydroxyacylglutathione hydrolase
MYRSLSRLAELSGDTRVCCAHEYTIDNLRFAFSVEPGNSALVTRIRDTRAVRGRGGSSVPSTMETERLTNPFLRQSSEELCHAVRTAMPDRTLDSPEAIFTATRALKDRKDYKSIPDSALPSPEA